MIVELGYHDMGEQSRSGLASLNRQGRHNTCHSRITALADHALFDVTNDLHRRRYMLHHLDHLVGGLQERCATTGGAIAGGRIDQLFGWKTTG
jgi:hypothetical protein